MLVGVFVVAEVKDLFLGEDAARGDEEEEEGEGEELRFWEFVVGVVVSFVVNLLLSLEMGWV